MSTLVRHHVTALVNPEVSEPVGELRRRWDPEISQADRRSRHCGLPEEIPDPVGLEERAAIAAASTAPFELDTGPAFYDGSPSGGVVFPRVHDLEGGLRRFQAAAVPAGSAISYPVAHHYRALAHFRKG
jgi:hypothetical protein